MGRKKPATSLIAPSAIVDSTAQIGKGTRIWAFSQIAEHARIGRDCVIGNGVYVDRHVKVGHRVRIHNKALLYHGLVVEDDVFIGPGVCFTNDPRPRSGKTRDMRDRGWFVRKGASIGANATILPEINIGSYAVVGAGSVVTHDVPPHVLFYGNPARLRGLVCFCGFVVRNISPAPLRWDCNSSANLEDSRSAAPATDKLTIGCESCGKLVPLLRKVEALIGETPGKKMQSL